jgi:hypothetical protein
MSKARELAELGAVYDSGALSNRNLIINGNMEIAQRGTSQTAAGYGTLDRFQLSLSGASATMTQESFTIGQTDVVGSDKYLKLAVSTGNNNSGVYHKVEAKNAFPAIGQKVTLSYYAKGTSPSAGLEVAIGWYDGSSSSPLASTAVTLTSSWVKYTHTFDVPSISGLTLTNAAAYLEVHWIQSNSDTGTGAYEVNLAQTQLEVGTEATPFEHRSFGQELVRCERYFYKTYEYATKAGTASSMASSLGRYIDAAQNYASLGLPSVNMRATPTTTLYNPNSGTVGQIRSDSTDHSAVGHSSIGQKGGSFAYVNNSSLSQSASTRLHITFEAEL